ncbi:MAG: mobile mystery protein A [Bacteroidota bacterium]
MGRKSILLDQLNQKMTFLKPLADISSPLEGWIRCTRTSLGIGLRQLGARLSVSKQGVRDMEIREAEGGITIRSLREAGRAMNMRLVYGFVPEDGTLDALIERRALELAQKIVGRTSTTMALEGQSNSADRIGKAIRERADELKREMPAILWD